MRTNKHPDSVLAQRWSQTRNASERRAARIRLLEMLLARCRCAMESRDMSSTHPTLLSDICSVLADEGLSSRNRRFNRDLTP